jgi:hypothetical protein
MSKPLSALFITATLVGPRLHEECVTKRPNRVTACPPLRTGHVASFTFSPKKRLIVAGMTFAGAGPYVWHVRRGEST